MRALEGVGGERDDRDVPRPLVPLEAPGRLPAVDLGQREVHEDDVGEQLEGLGEGLAAVRRGGHPVLAEQHVLGADLAPVGDVVDHQDERRKIGRAPRPRRVVGAAPRPRRLIRTRRDRGASSVDRRDGARAWPRAHDGSRRGAARG